MSAADSTVIDKATQESFGLRLEDMYHSATAMHDLCFDLTEYVKIEQQHLLRAIRDMAKAQARDLEEIAGKLTGDPTGYFESHFSKY
jgi:hypothetical protein